MVKLILRVLAVVVLMGVPTMFADIVAVGDPFLSNSWGQRWVGDVGTYDQMEIYFISGISAGFENPAFSNFSLGGWSQSNLSNTHAVARGPVSSMMQFDITYLGVNTNSLVFDFVAFNGTTRVDSARVTWSPGWSYQVPGPVAYERTSVPEGFTWPLTAASSLIALVGLARRRAKSC